MNQIIFLLLLTMLAVGLPFIFNFSHMIEGYSNYYLNQTISKFPDAQTKVLVQDTYPTIGKNQLSNDGANDIWWHYPTFELGSYDQITNNIRYPNNPDTGRCTPASMCGALYYEKKVGSNYINPLPENNPDHGTRVGYFTTNEQVITSLPYRTNMQNILY
jgi:hypothetical protein